MICRKCKSKNMCIEKINDKLSRIYCGDCGVHRAYYDPAIGYEEENKPWEYKPFKEKIPEEIAERIISKKEIWQTNRVNDFKKKKFKKKPKKLKKPWRPAKAYNKTFSKKMTNKQLQNLKEKVKALNKSGIKNAYIESNVDADIEYIFE